MQPEKTKLQALAAACCAAGASLCLLAGGAQAATYPAGGSTFSGSAEGWQTVGTPSCNIGLLGILGTCSASGGYDGTTGHPAGSLKAEADIALNLGGLLSAAISLESPNFVATEGGGASLSLEQSFTSAALLSLNPKADYSVALLDRTTGTSTPLVASSLTSAETTFTGKSGAANVVAGHTYAIAIASTISSSLVSVNLTGGAALRFDNVALTVGGSGGGGNGGAKPGGNGGAGGPGGKGTAAGLTSSRLFSLFRRGTATTPMRIRGNRIFAKVSCPRKVGRACRITAQGMLNRRKPATRKRTVKVGKGKGRQIVLRIKPRFKKKLSKRKRLLVREKVRAGKAKATVFKNRKLIRRR